MQAEALLGSFKAWWLPSPIFEIWMSEFMSHYVDSNRGYEYIVHAPAIHETLDCTPYWYSLLPQREEGRKGLPAGLVGYQCLWLIGAQLSTAG